MNHKSIESQTTAILYQGPTAQEQRVPRSAVIKANAKDAVKFVAITAGCWAAVTGLVSWTFG